MSDMPTGYYIGHTGVVLLDFRRDPLPFPVLTAKKKRGTREGRKLKAKLRERDGRLCHYCDKDMAPNVPGEQPKHNTETLEHIFPRSHGGTNEQFNCVLACSKCNNNHGNAKVKCDCEFCDNARSVFAARAAYLNERKQDA